MARILHIVLNGYTNDNRVRRAAECGRDIGFEVGVFALSAPGFPDKSSEQGIQIHRFNLSTRSWSKTKMVQLLKYVEVILRMAYVGVLFRPLIVHAHDVDALPIGHIISIFTRAKLVYDAHELWADPAHFEAIPHWMAKIVAMIEGILAKRASECITVSGTIAQHMANNQHIKPPAIIRNVPEPWPKNSQGRLRSKLGILEHKVIILYQGVIGGQGVLTLAQAFRRVEGNVVLVFLGDGPAIPNLRSVLSDLGDRVAFHPFVSAQELPYFTADADIGVASIPSSNTSYLLCLPNKFFEYIQGGLAVVASELPEMASVIRSYGVGVTFPPGDIGALTMCLQSLVDNPGLLATYREASRLAACSLNWEIEKNTLINIYQDMGKGQLT